MSFIAYSPHVSFLLNVIKLCGLLLLFVFSVASYGQQPIFHVILQNHVFVPDELEIPANKKVQLIIENKDDEAEEFDSFDLNREKVIFPKRKARLFIGPLAPGTYEYFGEFHPDTAKGKVIVVEPNVIEKTERPRNKAAGEENVN